jgi:hypothetical protein
MKRSRDWLFWAPRILSILFICFITMFSFDAFEPGLRAGEIALRLLLHNIPTLILIALLIVSWKHDLVGAIGYLTIALIYMGMMAYSVITSNLPWYLMLSWNMTIAGPALAIGILFFIHWKKQKKADAGRI